MQEVERILKEIMSKLAYRDSGKCIDINGNTVGSYGIEWGGIDSE